MKLWRAFGLIITLSVTSASAHAADNDASGYLTTGKLIAMCNLKSETLGYWVGFIRGVSDTLDTTRVLQHHQQCVPDDEDDSQLFRLVMKYEAKHPEQQQDLPATTAVISAHADTFSCGRAE
jgi:Rap1a immunity proteins